MLVRHSVSNGSIVRSLVYLDVAIGIVLEGGVPSEFSRDVADHLEDAGDNTVALVNSARKLFNGVNPNTGKADISGSEVYAPLVLKGVHSGLFDVQMSEDGKALFNGEGVYRLSDLLVSLGVLFGTGMQNRKSLDNISLADDYFNLGYNICCWGLSSYFFNLYRRDELMRPITRIELAYILVMCANVFGSIHQGQGVGVMFNWLAPKEALDNYTDGCSYNVSLKSKNGMAQYNIKEYLDGRSVGRFIDDIQSGKSAIPMSMFMSLVELSERGAFINELKPLRQVSRGEALYVLNTLEGGKDIEDKQ